MSTRSRITAITFALLSLLPLSGPAVAAVSEVSRAWIEEIRRPPLALTATVKEPRFPTLPEPGSWPELRVALNEAARQARSSGNAHEFRRLQAGAWLLTYLLGERDVLTAELAQALAQSGTNGDGFSNYALRSLKEALSPERANRSLPQSAQKRLESLELVLSGAERPSAAPSGLFDVLVSIVVNSAEGQSDEYVPTAELPDLITLLGPVKAELMIKRAFGLRVQVSVDEATGEPTRKLARSLLLSHKDTVKVASWTLVDGAETVFLHEHFSRRFPREAGEEHSSVNHGRNDADARYLRALLQAARIEDAVAFIRDEKTEFHFERETVLREFEKREPELAWRFLKAQLAQAVDYDAWHRFYRLSAQLERMDEAKRLLNELEANGRFSGLGLLTLQRLKVDAEIAAGEFPGATLRIAETIKTPGGSVSEKELKIDLALRLMGLARLFGDTFHFNHARSRAEALIQDLWTAAPNNAPAQTAKFFAELNDSGSYSDTVRLGGMLFKDLAALRRSFSPSPSEAYASSSGLFELSTVCSELLRAYVHQSKWDEASALIELNPFWAAADAAELSLKLSSRNVPVAWYFARLAEQRGDRDLARRVLEAALVASPGSDALYESYLGLIGPDVRPLLVKLEQVNRYEERPLIWQARLLLDTGNAAEAIPLLERAIAIDPSDGETGAGDRMRVYAQMSEAMAMRGDPAKSRFFADVVRAIRVSETADEWYSLGAYTKAIARYREALTFFQDAYCIQSRLAVRLANEGRMDEAVEHYRRAFELMPDSFGRVESHCFGCEHVFSGDDTQGIAEEVFTRMIRARPDKPQLHYLMGYLREEQKRLPEAAESYRTAVRLDPLYLNAWSRLTGLSDSIQATPQERDDLLCKLVELDPSFRRVSSYELRKVTDHARLWKVLNASKDVLTGLPRSDRMWALPASARQQAEAAKTGAPSFSRMRREIDFASVIEDTTFVRTLHTYASGERD